MGADLPKQFLPLCGKPVIAHTLSRFEAAPRVDSVIIVVPEGQEEEVRSDVVSRYGFAKVASVLAGGELRQDSVHAWLDALPDGCDIVLIHDAVRPMIEESTIDQCIDAAKECGAAVVAVRVKDTIKEADEGAVVLRTLEREALWSIQTPQCFRVDLIKEAHQRASEAGFSGTDDAVLVERLGGTVRLIEGSHHNIKITTPEDLVIAEAILGVAVREG